MIQKEINLLIVEDNHVHARLAQTYLTPIRETDYHMHIESDLQGALEYLVSGRPLDVILLDLSLPGTSGLDTLQAVQMTRRDVAVLIYTSSYDTSIALKAVVQGASGYVTKGLIEGKTLHLYIQMAFIHHHLRMLQQSEHLVTEKASQTTYAILRDLPNIMIACCECHRWRDDSIKQGRGDAPDIKWLDPEQFLRKHKVNLSHTYCPTCKPPVVKAAIGLE